MTYVDNRKKYTRPQAMIWAENNTIVDGTDYEIGADTVEPKTFLILSDHNRSEINLQVDRIENRQRMINGRMRSFHVADKQKISVSWDMLPSRRFSDNPLFDTTTGQSIMTNTSDQHTVDGGAGGADLLDWYDNHTGPFWVYLAYDKPSNFQSSPYDHLVEYVSPIEMYIADFSYTVIKRGNSTYDFWNVSVTLEEV